MVYNQQIESLFIEFVHIFLYFKTRQGLNLKMVP